MPLPKVFPAAGRRKSPQSPLAVPCSSLSACSAMASPAATDRRARQTKVRTPRKQTRDGGLGAANGGGERWVAALESDSWNPEIAAQFGLQAALAIMPKHGF